MQSHSNHESFSSNVFEPTSSTNAIENASTPMDYVVHGKTTLKFPELPIQPALEVDKFGLVYLDPSEMLVSQMESAVGKVERCVFCERKIGRLFGPFLSLAAKRQYMVHSECF